MLQLCKEKIGPNNHNNNNMLAYPILGGREGGREREHHKSIHSVHVMTAQLDKMLEHEGGADLKK